MSTSTTESECKKRLWCDGGEEFTFDASNDCFELYPGLWENYCPGVSCQGVVYTSMISTDKTIYQKGEQVDISWDYKQDTPLLKDWIAVYPWGDGSGQQPVGPSV